MGKVETGSARRGASRAAGRSTLWRSLADDFALRRDGTEARMAVLQQVMLAVVVLVITAFAIIAAIPGDLTLFFVGVAMVFVMTIVTMLVPWNAISPWAVGIVPVIDVVAILFMRAAFPESRVLAVSEGCCLGVLQLENAFGCSCQADGWHGVQGLS